MVRGLYTAYTGMLAQEQRLDAVSNNLANVNTTAFKQDGVLFESFDEVYMTKINDPESRGDERIGSVSMGIKVGQVYTNFEQGALQETGSDFDIALEGDGMISVGSYDEDGNITENYTRDGAFLLNSNGELVTNDGYFVMGSEGPITISGNAITINEQGKIYVDNEYVDTIKLVDFEDMTTLNKLGSGIYEATDETVFKDFSSQVAQGFLESSNVNSVKEMINMINVNRDFETNQKVLTTYDEMLDKAVNSIGNV
jgi:flagellar basal-body rod protein FlgG